MGRNFAAVLLRRCDKSHRKNEEIYQFTNFLGAVKKRIIQRIFKHFDLFPIERFVRALPVTRSCVHLKGFFFYSVISPFFVPQTTPSLSAALAEVVLNRLQLDISFVCSPPNTLTFTANALHVSHRTLFLSNGNPKKKYLNYYGIFF